MSQEYSASAIAEMIQGTIKGNADSVIHAVNSLRLAEPGELSFVNTPKHLPELRACKASIVLVPADWGHEPEDGQTLILCADPDKAFSKLCGIFAPPPLNLPPGTIHPTAFVDPTAQLAEDVYVGPNAVIMEGAVIGKGTRICACSYIGQFSKIGENCILHPGARVLHRCILGKRVLLHSGVVIGADGFGYNPTFRGLVKVPQNGIVKIDDDVEVGANSTIDRARFGITWIKKGVKIDNLVQVGHNVIIGESSVLIAQSGVAGSAELGRGVVLAAKAGVNGHITMGDGSKVLGCSAAQKSVAPGDTVYGVPGENQKDYLERFVLPTRVRKMKERLEKLEKELDELKKGLANE